MGEQPCHVHCDDQGRQRPKLVWRSAHAGPEARHGRLVRARGGAKAVLVSAQHVWREGAAVAASEASLHLQHWVCSVASCTRQPDPDPWEADQTGFSLVDCLLTHRVVAERLDGAFCCACVEAL